MKKIVFVLLTISISMSVFAQKDNIWYSFQDEETEQVGFKDKDGNIKLEAKFSILTFGKFDNIIPLGEINDSIYQTYYLLKNGQKVGFDSLWVFDIAYDCENEGFIRFQDENRQTGMFNKKGKVQIPADYNYLSQFKNGIAIGLKNARQSNEGHQHDGGCNHWSWLGGTEYLIDTNNQILIENFTDAKHLNFYSLQIENTPSTVSYKKNYLGLDGKYYTFLDNKKLFEYWFLNTFIQSLDKTTLTEHTHFKVLYNKEDVGWTLKENNQFVNDNFEILKKKFSQFLNPNTDFFISNETSVFYTYYFDDYFDKYSNNCGELDNMKTPILNVIVQNAIGSQDHFHFIKTEKGFQLICISIDEETLK